jgi:uncharacterized protein (TIGR03437 family)
LIVQASDEMVPAGSAAQIKFTLLKPQAISSGELTVNLDPAIFGDVISATAFSATGDAYGYASVQGQQVDVHFQSSSGGIGRVAGQPIVVVTVAIRADAMPGARATVTADPGPLLWRDAAFNAYTTSVLVGNVTIGGAISIGQIQPGSGLLAAGTVLRIDGSGFTSASIVEIQGAIVSSVSLVSPQQLNVTLGGATEIAGKRVRVRNTHGGPVDFWPSRISGVLSTSATNPYFNSFPIVPAQAYTQARTPAFRVDSGWLVLQNPNAGPVDVAIESMISNLQITGETRLRIAAGGSLYQDVGSVGITLENSVAILASAPIQMLELTSYTNYFSVNPPEKTKTATLPNPMALGPLRVNVNRGDDSLAWVWQTGGAPLTAKSFSVYSSSSDEIADFTVSAIAGDGGKWFSVTPSKGTTCILGSQTCNPPVITVSVDPAGLAPGIYRGAITLSPLATSIRPDVAPTLVAVALTVTLPSTTSNILSYSASFATPGPPNDTHSQTFNLPPDAFPGPFSVKVLTDSGGNWLSAASSGSTGSPQLTVTADVSALAPGKYSGEVIVTGSGNTMVIPAEILVYGGVQLYTDYPLRFSVRAGDPAPPARIVPVKVECFYTNCPAAGLPATLPFSAFVKTNSGGDWLSALPGSSSFSVSINPAGLAPGIYTGAITLASSATAGSTQVPVVLNVWSGPQPALTASPAGIYHVWQIGASADYICVDSANSALPVDARAVTNDGGDWLTLTLIEPVTLTCGLSLSLDGSTLAPGVHTGSIVVTSPGQSLTIPVTFVVPAPPQPVIGAVVNAASAAPGAIAARELVTIHGSGLAGAQILLDGTALTALYRSDTQINASIPPAVSGNSSAALRIQQVGQSISWTLPVTAAAPAIFTIDGSGQGGAAVLNEDNSVNGPSNAASRGSIVQIFATGIDPTAGLTVSVTIGGKPAVLLYSGAAPGATDGLYQVNAIVPQDIEPAAAVPIVITAGSLASPSGVTIAVR